METIEHICDQLKSYEINKTFLSCFEYKCHIQWNYNLVYGHKGIISMKTKILYSQS